MRLLSLVFLIALVFAGVGCKKDKPTAEPTQKTIWKAMPDSIISITDRNIIASYSDDSVQYLMTPYVFYSFDSTGFAKKEAVIVPEYYNLYQRIAIGKRFTVFNAINNEYLNICDNVLTFNHSSTQIKKVDIIKNEEVRFDDFTTPNANSNFYLATTIGKVNFGDSNYVLLTKYKVTRDAYTETKVEWSKMITPKAKYSNFGVRYLTEIDQVVYATFGFTLRIVDGIVTDTIPFGLKDIVKINDTLYASCIRTVYTNPLKIYDDGIAFSTNNGKTWRYFGTGLSFSDGNLITMDNKLFLHHKFWLLHINPSLGTLQEIDKEGINGVINTVNLFKDKVYIGTDAGVYYKNYKSFFVYK